jgi:hypothetical protein
VITTKLHTEVRQDLHGGAVRRLGGIEQRRLVQASLQFDQYSILDKEFTVVMYKV